MIDIHTLSFVDRGRTVTYDIHHDGTYIPDAVLKQCPVEQLEPETWRFLMRACRPGDTVVDAGANVGYMTLLMSKLVGPAGFVHAFEPHPDTARRLDRNVALNKCSNVLVHETALWDANRDLTLYTCFEPGLASMRPYEGWTGSRTVRTERLDRILPDPPHVIKMDIEGSELAALKGCEKWLAHVSFLICELAHPSLARHGTSVAEVTAYMRGFGKDLWLPDPDGRMPTVADPDRWPDKALNQMGLFASHPAVAELWEPVDVAT